jgi:quercetin dioxygenase-like cupin family protein
MRSETQSRRKQMNRIGSIGITAGPNAPSWEKRVRLKTVTFSPSIVLTALLAIPLIAASFSASAQEKKVKGTVLEQVDLGNLPAGGRAMKMTLLELQPGAEIPRHTHKGPGLRYVIDGAISIAWKDREVQTFKAGSTYFEGAGENHPPTEMSAKNAAEGVTRVLIVELLPKE